MRSIHVRACSVSSTRDPLPGANRQLKPLDRRGHDSTLEMKGARQFFNRRRSPKQQHRHAREIATVEREDLSRHIVERIRGVLESRDGSTDCLTERRTRRRAGARQLRL